MDSAQPPTPPPPAAQSHHTDTLRLPFIALPVVLTLVLETFAHEAGRKEAHT